MKSKKGIIALIVTLSIITLLLIGLFVLFLTKGNVLKKYFRFEFKNHSKIILDQKYDANHLDVFTDYGDITIKYSDDDQIRVIAYGKNKNNIQVIEDEKSLKIKNKQGENKFIGFSFTSYDLIIYVPKSYDKNVILNTDYGDIKVIDLENSELKIDVDYGDVEIGNVKSLELESDYGDVEINRISNYLNMNVDYGEIEIDTVNLIKDSKIKSNFGDIEIKQTNDIYIQAKTELGEVNVKQSNRYANIVLDIYADYGDIKVND